MTRRLPSAELERLGEAVCGSQPGLEADTCAAAAATYRLLGASGAVTAEGLAAVLGWEPARGARALAQLPNAEVDADGAVVGFGGLTVRPTPHRIVVDGRVRYAWCAWDTLFLPVALDAEVKVTSRCPHTGRRVTLTVAPTGIRHRDPEGVVLSFVHPDAVDTADLRGTFCGAVHFLADAAIGEQWSRQARAHLVLDLDDAFVLGRRMILERCGPATGPRSAASRD